MIAQDAHSVNNVRAHSMCLHRVGGLEGGYLGKGPSRVEAPWMNGGDELVVQEFVSCCHYGLVMMDKCFGISPQCIIFPATTRRTTSSDTSSLQLSVSLSSSIVRQETEYQRLSNMRATTVLIIASFIIPNFAVPVSVGDVSNVQ
jgi:hypothetical protein